MKPVKSIHLCEKHAKEFDPETLEKITSVKAKPPVRKKPSTCSCLKCDSLVCFEVRNSRHCACNEKSTCQPPLLINTNNLSKIDRPSTRSINAIKPPEIDSIPRERVKNEVTFEYKNNQHVNIVKKISRYSYRCLSSLTNRDIRNDKTVSLSLERLTTRSGTISYSRLNFDPNTPKLSTQIMNVPYEDFKESISDNKLESATPKPTFLTRYDILARIKEAYKACSCKICECLIGKSKNPSEYCTCKPCQCDDCRTLLSKIKESESGNVKENSSGCSCIRYVRKRECKGMDKKGLPAYCDCDTCDSLKCTEKLTPSCNCQPCECIECKSYLENKPKKNNTLVVASMREDFPRAFCQCSPCDCAECGQDFTLSSSVRREIGTGINRPVSCCCDTCVNQSCETHDGNSCTCDVKKQIMRKPVEKDTRDYGIHRASVKKNVIERKSKNQNDTIAMFAAKGNRLPEFDIEKKYSCSCGDCECIVCSCKDNKRNSVTHKNISQRTNACKCSPCECVICENRNYNFVGLKNVCKCDICDCVQCDSLSQPSSSNDERHANSIQLKSIISLNASKCSPCECHDCQKMMYKCIGDSCYCTHRKCQMCTDQTKFINETVYRNRNGDLPFTYGNTLNKSKISNKNNGKTCLPQYENKGTVLIRSKQSISNESSNVNGMKDNSLRKSTHVLISNTKEQKKYQLIDPCDAFTECKEKQSVQSFHRAPDYESSRSITSDNSSLGLNSRISNLQPNVNLYSVKEHVNLSNSPTSILIKFPVNNRLDDFTNFSSATKTNQSYEDTSHTILFFNTANEKNYLNMNSDIKGSCPEINSVSQITKNEFPVGDEHSHSNTQLSKAYPSLSKTYDFTEKDQEITNVMDLSLNLIASLRNANERLSVLMKPRGSYNHAQTRPKADISLPKKLDNRTKLTNDTDKDINFQLKNPYLQHHVNFSDIDYDKIRNTLQQAKAFSVELSKVLKDFQKANRKLECKSLREAQKNSFGKTQVNSNPMHKTNNLDIDILTNGNVERRTLVEGIGQETSVAYEPVNKYGSHNLNVLSTKEEISDIEGYQVAKIKSMTDEESNNITHDVEEDINAIGQQVVMRNTSKLNNGNILINEPSSSVSRQIEDDFNKHSEPLTNSIKLKNEGRYRSRSDKTQRNIKSNKIRVPGSIVLYKRLKLKEALINLSSDANVTGIRQNNLVPQSIQCDNKDRAVISGEITQHEPNIAVEKPQTTSTSTDASVAFDGRNEFSRFAHPVQAAHGLETWSLLKKNCLINSPYLQSEGITLMPPLLLDIKDTLRAMSQDGGAGRSEPSDAVSVTGHGNRALLKLQTEVNKLWESSLRSLESESKPGSPVEKSKLESKDFNFVPSQTRNMTNSVEKAVDYMDNTFSAAIPQRQDEELLKITSVPHPVVKRPLKVTNVGNSGGTSMKSELIISKSSCDALKVKFLGLRRVSDHTVVVKWKAPQDLTSVQGYELLVDGRAVQKILGPARCMAVVTCLPHIEKVLITIRTLVEETMQRTHYPSATITYRTRGKLI